MVSKTDNQREPFNRDKLRDGVALACRKRPIDRSVIEKTVDDIEHELQEYVFEVPSRIIGEKVLKKLLELDPIAYIRFASVYYQYADIDTFLNELKRIKEIKEK